jgi:DNA polymerase I-like protein with 3'-5' exonuclease and polymerase domains
LTEVGLLIPRKTPPLPHEPKVRKLDGLLLMEPESVLREGECLGGRYVYVDQVGEAVSLLSYWSDQRAVAAVDLETGAARRDKIDPDTGVSIPAYERLIDPFSCPIFLASASVEPGVAVVFDWRSLFPSEKFQAAFRRFLTECRLVAHNSLFEQSFFLAHLETEGNFLYDTLIAHQVAYAGLEIGHGLNDLAQQYLRLKLEKKWQRFFMTIHPTSPIPNEAIAYSATDSAILLSIAQRVEQDLRERDLWKIWSELERPLMPWIARAQYRGVCIDQEAVRQLSLELEKDLEERLTAFQSLAPDVLVTSFPQLKRWFEAQGVTLASTDEKNLKRVAETHKKEHLKKAAQAVLDYRSVAKIKSTYVDSMLGKFLNPKTGRVHPWWKQCEAATGRMSSSDPAVQTVPGEGAYARLRKMFVAETGHLLVAADLSQYEVRVIADLSGEEAMIDIFLKASAVKKRLEELRAEKGEDYPEVIELVKKAALLDFHTSTAAHLFKAPADQVSKEQRRLAKTVNFAVAYGAGAPRVAVAAEVPIEDAREIVERYYQTYPKVKRWSDEQAALAKKGWNATPAGRKRFYQVETETDICQRLMGWRDSPESQEKWHKTCETWESKSVSDLVSKMRRFDLGRVERQGKNHVVQSTNVDVLKLATTLLAPRLLDLDPGCQILLWVHDEVVITAPSHLAQEAAILLKEGMIQASAAFLKRVPAEVEVGISSCWSKT